MKRTKILPFITRGMLCGAFYFMQRSILYLISIESNTVDHIESVIGPEKRKIESKKEAAAHKIDDIKIIESLLDLTEGKNYSLKCEKSLLPIYNRVKDSTAYLQDTKIPRIVHLSYKSRCLPQDLANFTQMWSEALPNYSIFFHDDEAVDKLLHEEWNEFPHLHEILKCIKSKGAMLIDLWRMLVLYKYGGLYTDIDNVPTKIFTEDLIEPSITGFLLSDRWTRPTQNFLALEPRHPIAYNTILEILKNVWNLEDIANPKVVFVTGPQALKIGFQKFAHKSGDEIFHHGNDMYLTGFSNKTVKKLGNQLFIDSKPGWDDIVPHPHDMKLNVTRKERFQIESGAGHWITERNKNKNRRKMARSCKQYLYKGYD